MLLRYNSLHPVLVEIYKMSYQGGCGIFNTSSGDMIKTQPMSEMDWARYVSDMFVDGKLSYQGEVTVIAGQRNP